MPVLIWEGVEGLATVLGIGAAAKSLDSSSTAAKAPMSGTEMALIAFAAYYLFTKGLK